MYQPENWGSNPYEYIPSNLDSIDNPNNLYEAFRLSKKGVNWKESVQRYEINMLSKIAKAYYDIENGIYLPKPPFEFTLNERGRDRSIKAVCIEDRVIQRSLNDNILTPALANYLIYDNGASQTGKGLSFARDRFVHHLRQYYMRNRDYCDENGNIGYVLFIDFSKYFDNIIHSTMLQMLQPLLNEDVFNFVDKLFQQFKVDVSYMTDDEYASCLDNLFVMLDHDHLPKDWFTGEKFMEKSVGIGNQMSQITGLFYPHTIDNYCKIILGIKGYARYMDDTYIMGKTKEELWNLLNNALIPKYQELGIHVNQKKTKIVPMSSEMMYLKIKYILRDTGRIIQLVPRETFDREYRRLDTFERLISTNRMTLEEVTQCFISWYGSYYQFDSKKKLDELRRYFRLKFNFPPDYYTNTIYMI